MFLESRMKDYNKEYQVFISFKKTDDNGNDTEDLLIAREVYNYLTDKGLRVFFSEVVIPELGTHDFNHAINKALGEVQVLVAVVGKNVDNLSSPYVRSEWEGFEGAIRTGSKPNGRFFTYMDPAVDQHKLPYPLCNYHFFKHSQDSLKKLHSFISKGLDIEPVEKDDKSTPEEPPIEKDQAKPEQSSEIEIDTDIAFKEEDKKVSDTDKVVTIDESLCQDGIFFENGEAILFFKPPQLVVYGLDGQRKGEIRFPYQIKEIISEQNLIVLTSWEGSVLLVSDEGKFALYEYSNDNADYYIPAAVSIHNDNVLVGFWNGEIYQCTFEHRVLIHRHAGGIQKLKANDTYIFLCDLNSRFHVRSKNEINEFTADIERSIHYMRLYDSCLVIVGQGKIYRYSLKNSKLIPVQLRLSQIKQALNVGELILIVDEKGQHQFIDQDLIPKPDFQYPEVQGGRLIHTDTSGQYHLIEMPNGTRDLYRGNKRIYSHQTGVFCIDSNLVHAIGNLKTIDIYKSSHINMLEQGIENG